VAALHALSAVEARQRIAEGGLSALDYAQALIGRIADSEPAVQAWAWFSPDALLAQARAVDARHAAGAVPGPLAGLPIGIKDIIDTAGVPTELGTPLHAGRVPADDAVVVQRLRRAGGLMAGKTVTTELATYAPGKTRHPLDARHTPGGSSSGSAAAVAAGMVPLAIGTQTNGSVIRPASFCGVVGFKPSFGRIDRRGVLEQSPTLDQVGVFGRSVADVALLAAVLCDDAEWNAMPAVSSSAPRLAIVRTPFWPRLDADARAAFDSFAQAWGAAAEDVDLPFDAEAALHTHRLIMEAEIAHAFADEVARGRDRLSDSLRGQIERGHATLPEPHREAVARITPWRAALDALLDRFDAIVTPAALGTAPLGMATGDPLMCTLWTLTGLPAISLPLLSGANGLPLGVQLVGRFNGDARLLGAASRIEATHRAA
jgi:Asp-tRNA(Asn)/Glu-tRNA(Gln) amidotransferase A subunit family amidase